MAARRMDTIVTDSRQARFSIVGFVLSLFLTVVPFALVMSGRVSRPIAVAGIACAALVQIAVHLKFFLHLRDSPRARWDILALIVTALIIILFVGGSLWIMHNLNYRMM